MLDGCAELVEGAVKGHLRVLHLSNAGVAIVARGGVMLETGGILPEYP